MDKTITRRGVLGAILGSAGLVALDGCFPFDGYGGDFRIPKHVTKGELKFSNSYDLNKYYGKSGDPYTSESLLVKLARTELLEDSFTYALPENAWYETGTNSQYNYTLNITPVLLRNSGSGILPNFKSLYNYHYHPLFLEANLLLKYSYPVTKEANKEKFLKKV